MEEKKLKMLMTTREVAEYCGLPESEIRRLVRENVLRPVKGFRRPKRFYGETVKKWLSQSPFGSRGI